MAPPLEPMTESRPCIRVNSWSLLHAFSSMPATVPSKSASRKARIPAIWSKTCPDSGRAIVTREDAHEYLALPQRGSRRGSMGTGPDGE